MRAVIFCAFAVQSLALLGLIPLPAADQTPATLTSTSTVEQPAPDTAKPEFALLPDAPRPASEAILAVPQPPTPPCPDRSARNSQSQKGPANPAGTPCLASENPYAPFLNSTAPAPLTPAQKAVLAVRDFQDPGNLASILYMSALTVGTDAHTAYGPGWKGFGEAAGYRTVRSATAEFVTTFLIPSLTHQDPRYHRMPNASVSRRVLHAVSHTVIAQSDNGNLMPNYGVLAGTPIRAEIANLYVPGVHCNLRGTARRVLNSYATDPVDDLITEFLPDVARHVHIHVLFVQRIIENVSCDH
jgi:hypothetical protein